MLNATGSRALAALGVGAVLIGLAPIFVRISEVGPVSSAFWRVAIAAPLLWATSGFLRRSARPSVTHAEGLGLAVAGALFAADLALWHYAIAYTSVANATLLANAAPIFVALASWLVLRERLSVGFLVGLGTAIAGTAILVGEGARVDSGASRGDALALAAAMFYAGYLMNVARLRRGLSTLTLMTWSSVAAALCLLPLALLLGENLLPSSLRGWCVLAGLAVLSHVGGQGLIAYSLATLPASFSSVALLTQPVAAAAFAWLFLAEGFRPMQAIGGLVVLIGIFLCRRASV